MIVYSLFFYIRILNVTTEMKIELTVILLALKERNEVPGAITVEEGKSHKMRVAPGLQQYSAVIVTSSPLETATLVL